MHPQTSKTRRLKICRKYFPRTYAYVSFPEILLAGKWLEDDGFEIGASVTVRHEKKRITITLDGAP